MVLLFVLYRVFEDAQWDGWYDSFVKLVINTFDNVFNLFVHFWISCFKIAFPFMFISMTFFKFLVFVSNLKFIFNLIIK